MSDKTLQDWISALGLKRSGGEFKGPCPLCGGKDRFHVRQGHTRLLAHCRQCQRPIKDLARATFGETARPRPKPASDKSRLRDALNERRRAARMREFAAGIEVALTLCEKARKWARSRGLNDKRLAAKGWRSIKPSWIKTPTGISWPRGAPETAILMPYYDDAGIHSYRLRGANSPPISFYGARATIYNRQDALWSGRIYKSQTLHVCEGETDTESLLEAGARCVIGVPGVSTLHDEIVKFTLHRFKKVIIWFDNDAAGLTASVRLGDKIAAKRKLALCIPWRRTDELANFSDANEILKNDRQLLAKMIDELK